MGASPDSTVSILNNAARTSYVIQAWRGTNAGTPLDVASTTATSAADSDPNSPSISPSTTGALIFTVGLGDDDDGTITTVPTGYSTSSSANTAQGSTTVGATVVMASKTWSSGAEDPAAWVLANFNDGWVSWTVALRPETISNETNTTTTAYENLGGDYAQIDSIVVKVEVDSYDQRASANRATQDPDLFLEAYDGSGWVQIGNFGLPSTYGTGLNTTNYNFSLSITNLSCLIISANSDKSLGSSFSFTCSHSFANL
jgi:hypothetical protein